MRTFIALLLACSIMGGVAIAEVTIQDWVDALEVEDYWKAQKQYDEYYAARTTRQDIEFYLKREGKL